MTELSLMTRLLDGVDVEWMTLGDIGEFIRGNGMQKKDFSAEGFPAIHYGQIFTRYGLSADETFAYVPEDLAAKLRKANKNDLLLATTSENDEDVVKPLAWLGSKVAISGDMMLFRHKQNVKYLAYCFQTKAFQSQKSRFISGAKVRRVSKDNLAKIYVPIPCPKDPKKSLAIQDELVHILDRLSKATQEVTRELTQELTARKKQYNYYRDSLLDFDEKIVEWKTLQEVALDFGRGKSKHRPRNDTKLYGGDIPLIQTGDIRNAPHVITRYSQTYSEFGLNQSKLWPKGTLCITIAANIAETAILGFDSCFPDSVIGFVANSEKTSSNYVEYLLSSWKTKLQAKSTGCAQENINLATFKTLLLPFPSVEEQLRLVSVISKFEDLTNSISENLLHEIQLHQKQYEYYRDLLLSFSKPEEIEM